jgi:hypothetical protein
VSGVGNDALAALDAFIEEGYDAVRGSGEMSAAYVVGACEALRDRFAAALDDAHLPREARLRALLTEHGSDR